MHTSVTLLYRQHVSCMPACRSKCSMLIAFCMLVIQDPSNEDEQARVMSQAQALLDCTADLVEHCGVLAAVDVLQVICP